MPNIYMTHPLHGAKIATMEAEAELDEQNGWVRFDPSSPETLPKPTENAMVKRRKREDKNVTEV